MKKESPQYLWEVFVPYHSNAGKKFSLKHHRQWDEIIRSIAGGLTIFKISKGQWVSDDNQIYFDKMIPVRIACTEDQIDKIIQITMDFYDQEAIFCFRVSDLIKIVKRDGIRQAR